MLHYLKLQMVILKKQKTMYIYLRLILKMKMIFLQLIMLKTLVEEKIKLL